MHTDRIKNIILSKINGSEECVCGDFLGDAVQKAVEEIEKEFHILKRSEKELNAAPVDLLTNIADTEEKLNKALLKSEYVIEKLSLPIIKVSGVTKNRRERRKKSK